MRPTEVIVRRTRWLAWRDLVMVLLAVAVVLMVRQVGSLQDQLRHTSAQRSAQIAALSDQVEALRSQLAIKDARIKQLSDLLVTKGIEVPPSPIPAPEPTLRPSATRTPTPRRTPSPTPAPRPTVSHHPSPMPSPSSCLVIANGTCITPPPQVGGPFAR